MNIRTLAVSVVFAIMALAFIAPAHAIDDPVVDSAINQKQVGEQADGYLGVVDGVRISDSVRSRINQINIQRRAAYTERAQARGVTVEEMARATGCALMVKNTPNGAMYRDVAGAWRTNSGGVALPSYCQAQ